MYGSQEEAFQKTVIDMLTHGADNQAQNPLAGEAANAMKDDDTIKAFLILPDEGNFVFDRLAVALDLNGAWIGESRVKC